MENTVYCLYQDYGSWDNYTFALLGIFSTEAKAEEAKSLLEAVVDKFKTDFPRPSEEDYNHGDDRFSLYNIAESKWWAAIFEAGQIDMLEINHYSIKAVTMNNISDLRGNTISYS